MMLKIRKNLRTASLKLKFTGSHKKILLLNFLSCRNNNLYLTLITRAFTSKKNLLIFFSKNFDSSED